MARSKPANQPREVVGPIGGAANNTTFAKTPSKFCPREAMQNARVLGASKRRLRFGQRSPLRKIFSQRMGVGGWDGSGAGSPVQALAVLGAVSGTIGVTRGSLSGLTTITNLAGGPVTGTVWILDSAGAMIDAISNTDAPVANQRYIGAFQVGWDYADATRLGWTNLCFDDSAGGRAYASAHLYRTDLRTQVWQTYVKDWDPTNPCTQAGGAVGTRPIIPNSIRVYGTYTYVSAGPYVYVFRTSDGKYLQRYNVSGWAEEVQDVRLSVSGGLYAFFKGSGVASGIIPADTAFVHEGFHVRTGVALFQVNADLGPGPGDVAPNPLTHVAFGQTLTTGANYENHQTFRLSEHLFRGYDGANVRTNPRGALPFGFALDGAGNIFCSFTNRGWGKTVATDSPGSGFAPTVVCKIGGVNNGQFGRLAWEADALGGSILDQYVTPGGVTMYNDIPGGGTLDRQVPNGLASVNGPGGDEPSIDSLCCDAAGDLYGGGHRTELDTHGGANVFKWSGTDGTPLWATRLSGMVYQHCMATDPTDGNIVVGGERNSAWEGSNQDGTGEKPAHLWKLSAATGGVMWHQDLNTNVSCFGVDVNTLGQTAYCTQTI